MQLTYIIEDLSYTPKHFANVASGRFAFSYGTS